MTQSADDMGTYVSDAFAGWPGVSSGARAGWLQRETARITEMEFADHPFGSGVNRNNVRNILADYATMSVGFPYIQAGAIARVYESRMAEGADISSPVEATTVVGAFLVWDEFGGHNKILRGGNTALPSILETRRAFHGNLLLDDCAQILGEDIKPSNSPMTRSYLRMLGRGLGSADDVERTAHMVAFEHHAGAMITALWHSLTAIYRGDRDELLYFHTHVGGDDPAEAYHMAMTARMVVATVPVEQEERFFDLFRDAYRMNQAWCQAVRDQAEQG